MRSIRTVALAGVALFALAGSTFAMTPKTTDTSPGDRAATHEPANIDAAEHKKLQDEAVSRHEKAKKEAEARHEKGKKLAAAEHEAGKKGSHARHLAMKGSDRHRFARGKKFEHSSMASLDARERRVTARLNEEQLVHRRHFAKSRMASD